MTSTVAVIHTTTEQELSQEEFSQFFALLLLANQTKEVRNEDDMTKPVADHIWRSCLILLIFEPYIPASKHELKDTFHKALILILCMGLEYIPELEDHPVLGVPLKQHWENYHNDTPEGNLAQIIFMCERYLTSIENGTPTQSLKLCISLMQRRVDAPIEFHEFINLLISDSIAATLSMNWMTFNPDEYKVTTLVGYEHQTTASKHLLFVSFVGRRFSSITRYEGQPYWTEVEYDYENAPSHCYMATMTALLLVEKLPPQFLVAKFLYKLLKLLIIHDLEETVMGDWPPMGPSGHANDIERRREKDEIELKSAIALFELLPEIAKTKLLTIWLDGNDESDLRTLSKAFDSIEAKIMIWEMTQGRMTQEHLEDCNSYSERRIAKAPQSLIEFMGWLTHHFLEHHTLPH